MENTLYIHRVAVNPPIGKTDVVLRPGLNIIRAVLVDTQSTNTNNQVGTRNSVGKSTFINLIDYGLGKDEFLKLSKETARIRLKDHELVMEYKIGNKAYTVQRNLVDGNNCTIFEGWNIDFIINGVHLKGETLSLSGYKDFLENALYGGANIMNQKRYVSFRDIMHLLIREQIGGFDSIDSTMEFNENGDVKRKRIEFLAGLTTPEKLLKEKEKSDTNKEVKAAKKSLDVIRNYVKEKVSNTEAQIKKQIKDTEKEIIKKSQVIADLKKQLIEFQDTSDKRVEYKNALLNKRLLLQKEEHFISSRLNSYQATLNEITTESETINVAQDARSIFSAIKYEQCPVCFVPITDDKDFTCPRGNNEVHSDSKAISTIQTILLNEKRDLSQAIEVLKENLFGINELRNNIDKQLYLINTEIKSDIELLIKKIDIEENILRSLQETMSKWTRLNTYLKDLAVYKKNYSDKKETLTNIEGQLKKINESIKERQDAFKIIYDEVVRYLYDDTRIGTLDISETIGKFTSDIRFNNNSLEIDDGAAAKTLRVVAFDLALLKLALDSDTYHPKLLIHDSPNAREIDPIVYERIFDFVKNELEDQMVKKNIDIDFQYIITTISVPSFVEQVPNYTRLTLNNDGDEGKLFEFTF